MTRWIPRRSLRDTLAANETALKAMSPTGELGPMQEQFDRNRLPPKRAHKRTGEPIEADVLRAVGELLAVHPQVLLAIRQNSGSLPYQDSTGRLIPIWFFKIVKAPRKIRLSDYWGLLCGDRAGINRFFAIECKRPKWKGPTDARELEQELFLQAVRECGGKAGFARSVDEAKSILDGAAA